VAVTTSSARQKSRRMGVLMSGRSVASGTTLPVGATGHTVSLPEETILAEVLGLRMIMINLLRELGNEKTLTPEKVQKVIQWADTEKLTTAVERLRDNEARRNS
jgi:hypothetical protein